MGLNPSCNSVKGVGLPVLGDGPHTAEQAETIKAELRAALPEVVFDVVSEQREVYRKGTRAHAYASAGMHFPGMAGPDDVETVTLYKLASQAHGWVFRRAWYYWVCTTRDKPVPEAVAREFNRTWYEQVRVEGCAGGQDVDGDVFSYHVDTPEGLAALAGLIREVGA